MRAEGTVCSVFRQSVILIRRNMHQARVVAPFKIDIGLIDETIIDNHVQAVGRAKRRKGTKFAIGEQRAGFILGRKADRPGTEA